MTTSYNLYTRPLYRSYLKLIKALLKQSKAKYGMGIEVGETTYHFAITKNSAFTLSASKTDTGELLAQLKYDKNKFVVEAE